MIRATLRHHAKERLQERTSLEPAAFLHLLDQNLSVSIGVESFTRRRHRLLYSEPDKAHFVAIQDFETGEVITLLPIDYHENLAWKLSEKSLRKAVWLVNPRLHQVPVLIASNTDDPQQLAEAIEGRPLYCLSPLILDWVGQPADERFMNYLDASCRSAEDPKLRPAEAVIQNQLFSENPI